MRFLRLIAIVLLLWSHTVIAVGICDRLSSDRSFAESERNYLVALCSVEIEEHEGPLVRIEGGFLPLPKQFYLKIPDSEVVLLSSAWQVNQGSLKEIEEWPFGTVQISRQSRVANREDIEFDHISSSTLDSASDSCALPMKLREFRHSLTDSKYITEFYELRIGETFVLLGGGSRNFAFVLADNFARLNCANEK